MLLGSVLFSSWALAVAVSDCRRRRVPNTLVAAGLFAAIACALAGRGPFGVAPLPAMFGAAVGLVALIPFFAMRVMGAGDVKVFAVLGVWCGAPALVGLWLAASIAAAVHALVLLVIARRSGHVLSRSREPTFALGRYRAAPYAALLVGAAMFSLLAQPFIGRAS